MVLSKLEKKLYMAAGARVAEKIELNKYASSLICRGSNLLVGD